MGKLTGKIAVVTGAGQGLGEAIAVRFANEGAAGVVVNDLNPETAAKTAELVKQAGSRALAIAGSVSDETFVVELMERAVKEMGSIDVLVNNAGIFPMTPFLKMDAETFDAVWRVNLRGLALLSKAAAGRMIEQGNGGAIVNIGSIDSVHPSMVGLAAYDASKGAVLMFTRSLALELAPHDIRVNAVLPGGIETEGTNRPLKGSGMSTADLQAFKQQFIEHRVPLGRMGDPDDVAGVVQFVASDAARYMTGAAIVVDGGALLT
jgi:2-deoxy-D-gluconate 3-dehydrogenase